ncbi:hypothetical protein E2562_017162 [Oryza meyeriana var. granulata]|uniref:Uncharacterized protein n=1 Tax=Oryza meyeriana var. granulata TaxID=110450 RepID=A0A6G1ELI1_9ORYZ|nr:hypothetical protein E2562_017162 [Oryza meyeriana var. granulata]
MAPPLPLFDLNEPPPEEEEEDIADDAATACEESRSPLEVDGGMADGSTARGPPSPPAPEDDCTGGLSETSQAEVATLTTPCSHADDGVDMHGMGPVHASRHGGRASPPRTSLPDFHDTASPSHMPRRHNPTSVPRDDHSTFRRLDDYGADSGSSHGGSRGAGSPPARHNERSMRSHPYAMHGAQVTPQMNRRRWRPKRQGYNAHDPRQQVNNYQDQRQVYNNGQDQRQQANNGRDQRQQMYNNGQHQRQQVYNNGQHQRRQGHHGHRRPGDYRSGQGQHRGYAAPNRQEQYQGYYSGRPSAGQYAGGESYVGRQVPAKQQQPSTGAGYQQHREPSRGQQRHVKPYNPMKTLDFHLGPSFRSIQPIRVGCLMSTWLQC